MTNSKQESDRPEAGADTQQGRPGKAPDGHVADSGGTRTRAGSDYGDFVPERSRRNDDRDAGTPAMGDYYTGGGNIDRLADEPGAPRHPQAAPEQPGRTPRDDTAAQKEETAAEANRNKSFDTTHVHTSATSRKV